MFTRLHRILARAFSGPFGPLLVLAALVFAVSTIERVALAVASHAEVPVTLRNLGEVLGIGAFFDALTFFYFAAPLAAWLAFAPARFWRSAWHRRLLAAGFLVATFVLVFAAVAEFLFWSEFASRFNFIAVDYLVYSREVAGNIGESYPLPWLLGGVAAATLALFLPARRLLARAGRHDMPRGPRYAIGVIALALPLAAFALVDERDKELSDNRFVNELAGNGLYELFAAYYDNELDYGALYPRIEIADAFEVLHERLATPGARFVSAQPTEVAREVRNAGPERRLNVVLVSVESLSAEFLGAFGGAGALTPNLDRLAREGLLFTRTYATGTRTVRGLEALALSLPPTPGQSIVRRPGNAGLSSLAAVFNAKGYVSLFLYGGYGWFDDMNRFFAANGYRVVDRTAIPHEAVHFENAWGVADEDLYDAAVREFDARHASGRPFFAHIMTTSNHRPFTYPGGRIDIPSGAGREGAVKYTDWAIGHFIDAARARPWFRDTVFVITADHTAGAAGKSDLPPERYHIPLLVYAPGHVAPGRVERLTSQIDVGPTVLGMLGFSYTATFFGQDVLRADEDHLRAFIATYRHLGYMAHSELVMLAPNRKVEVTPLPHGIEGAIAAARATSEAVAFYESAWYAYRNGLLRAPAPQDRIAASLAR
ncbi:MAG TPA: LTA synthase family protein [Burkholderiales bacterium]|nr:LTA synthase family protein [Burkholderiales bacterium]